MSEEQAKSEEGTAEPLPEAGEGAAVEIVAEVDAGEADSGDTPAEELAAPELPPEPEVPLVPPSPGQSLREAREALGMSVFEVAQSLRLSRKQIESMEANAWSELPGMTSIRGFIRNYARLVRLDSAPLLAMLEEKAATPGNAGNLELPKATTATLPEPGDHQRKDVFAVSSGVIMVVLAVAAFFFLPDGFLAKLIPAKDTAQETKAAADVPLANPQVLTPPAAPAEPVMPPASQPQANAPEAPPPVLNVPAAPATAVPSPAPATPAAVPTVLTTPPAPAAPAAVSGAIRLNFAGASWVEVRGKGDKIIFSQSNTAGSEKEVVGEGPYSLVIGNAAQVKLSYKGKPVDLEPHTKGAVARLTLE